jgi:hypothetical protein
MDMPLRCILKTNESGVVMKRERILCAILAILILLISSNVTVFAVNEQTDFSKAKLEQSTISELQELAQRATNDIEATAVYNELLDRVENSQVRSSVVIDTYITYYSTTVSGRSIAIYYKIKALVPSGATLKLGYEYPANTRTYGSSIFVSGKPVGSYHSYFTSEGLRCASRTYASFTARNYSEKAVYRTFYAFDTSSHYTYHTVTAAEVAINKVVLTAAEIYTMLTFPQGSFARWVCTIVGGLSIASIWSASPGISTGQFIQLYTYFSGGRMYQRVSIWHNYLAYQQGPNNPMYRSTSSAKLPGF